MVFGGEFGALTRFKDGAILGNITKQNEGNKIMYITLQIGKHNLIMGSDSPEAIGTHNLNENRSKIAKTAESKEEANNLHEGIYKDIEIEMSITDSVWGSYFGMFRDKYGIECC